MSETNTISAQARPLADVLAVATRHRFAVGSFSPRYTAMIDPILRAAEQLRSPLIVQISQREMQRYGIAPDEFGAAFRAALDRVGTTVPVVLHLDHSFELEVLQAAIAAGFTSVMMDGSAKPFEENVEISAQAAELAHSHGVSVECELGKIGTTDFVETDKDEEHYTVPEEAAEFVRRTGVDALAVSVGTAHGLYIVKAPKIDFDRLRAIRALSDVHLVLHGGSGVPAEMIQEAVQLEGGGISKVNIATDLEEALLASLGRTVRMTNAECSALPPEELRRAEAAVEETVAAKITSFLCSADKASLFN
ncbi:class II fructose-bisphosphate aldolase [Arsenicitalea aurantiaca]|uniref:Class II fructose-bisphosphate aldolase n=1 Tax=Arsenicitalea aurantiaca TaxID=1783274 RepID=A0A433X591_9HYPH|nr:class II fructose-bisphosphate aldolase [Arsenicitalea aurantiaca]RUT29250.1 class II fructose-bisphosphate aldolase [Arsenicitalea aurantiaca]